MAAARGLVGGDWRPPEARVRYVLMVDAQCMGGADVRPRLGGPLMLSMSPLQGGVHGGGGLA